MTKTALITGAASGIGHHLALKLVKAGVQVVSFDLKEPVNPIEGVKYLLVDVTSFDEVEVALSKLDLKFDLLVNNAGVMRRGNFNEISELDFDLVMKVNLKGAWIMLKLALPYLNEDAILLQMSSKNAIYLKESAFVYSLSKVGMAAISEMVQKSFKNFKVKTAFPGPVDTELETNGKTEKEMEELRNSTMVSPEFIAEKLFELVNAEETYLLYNQDHNNYYLSFEKPSI